VVLSLNLASKLLAMTDGDGSSRAAYGSKEGNGALGQKSGTGAACGRRAGKRL
jgi:hypothetical protein